MHVYVNVGKEEEGGGRGGRVCVWNNTKTREYWCQ